MSIRMPLAVRLNSSRASVDVTDRCRDIVLRAVDPGGYALVRCPLEAPFVFTPDELEPFTVITVYDARSGRTVGEAYLEEPNKSAGPDGRVWELVGYGPAAMASDVEFPYMAVDSRFGDMYRAPMTSAVGATANTGEDPGGSGNDALVLQFPAGFPIVVGHFVSMRHDKVRTCGQKLARIDYRWDGGLAFSDYHVTAVVSTGGGASETPRDQALTTTFQTFAPTVVGTDWTLGRNVLDLRLEHPTGIAATINTDTVWASFMNLCVRAVLYDKAGTELGTGASYTTNTVTLSQIVADLLGRPGVVDFFDGANATIAATSYGFDQAAWEKGTTFARIFEELSAVDPTVTWLAWERGFGIKHRFELRARPAAVRYEASSVDGFDSPEPQRDVYNEVAVPWVDSRGATQWTVRTQTVPSLGSRRRRKILAELSEPVASAAAATAAGDAFLADHRYPPNLGTLTVARPVRDLQLGRMVDPWEIEPANLIRVADVTTYPDALNASARDGLSVFNIRSSEFRASDAAARLELDSYSRTTARAISDLQRRGLSRRL